MNFVMKNLFVNHEWKYISVILLLQMILTISFLDGLRLLNIVKFTSYTFSIGKEIMFPAVLYCANVGFSLMSLSYVSIPVYGVIKRLTPGACAIISYIVLKKTEKSMIGISIVMLCIGTVLTGVGDLKFDLGAYGLGIGSVISQALYLVYIQQKGIKYDVLTMMYANSVNCIPILATFAYFSGETMAAFENEETFSLSLWIDLGVLLFAGIVLNYALFLCTTVNSALATTVTGVCKALVTTVLGFFTFGGQPLTATLLGGIAINTIGSIVYSYAKYVEKRDRETAKYVEIVDQSEQG